MSLRKRSSQESIESALPSLVSSDDSASDTEMLDDASPLDQEYMLPSLSCTPSLTPAIPSTPSASALQQPVVGADAASRIATEDDHTGGGLGLPHAPNDLGHVGDWATPSSNNPDEVIADHDGDGLRRPHLPDLLAQVESWVEASCDALTEDGVDEVFDLPDATDPLAGIGAQFDRIVLGPGIVPLRVI